MNQNQVYGVSAALTSEEEHTYATIPEDANVVYAVASPQGSGDTTLSQYTTAQRGHDDDVTIETNVR